MGCFQLLSELDIILELFAWFTTNVMSGPLIWTLTRTEMKNWLQMLLCYCRMFTTLDLRWSACCHLLCANLPYMLPGSFCSDTKVHYVTTFLQTNHRCQKWLLFEVQSGFWRLCPRGLLWSPETFDRVPTAEATDIRNLTLETSCQPLFHHW